MKRVLAYGVALLLALLVFCERRVKFYYQSPIQNELREIDRSLKEIDTLIEEINRLRKAKGYG